MPRDECAYVGLGPLRLTAACAVPPCFFTFMREATHSIRLQSAVHLLRIADLAPSIGSLLSLAGYSSSSSPEGICRLYQCSIAETVKRCKRKFAHQDRPFAALRVTIESSSTVILSAFMAFARSGKLIVTIEGSSTVILSAAKDLFFPHGLWDFIKPSIRFQASAEASANSVACRSKKLCGAPG